MTSIKQRLQQIIDARSGEWVDEQVVWLGDYNGDVETGTLGVFYARQGNGKVIRVSNAAHVPPYFDLQVRIGRSRSLPTVWQIFAIRETYDAPAGGGELAYHAHQHMFAGGDRVPIDRKQIMALTALVSDGSNFIITVIGGTIRTGNTHVLVSTQNFNMSAYVITAGAQFVNIEANETGALEAHVGTVFGSREIATAANIPVPTEGKYIIAVVSMYEGQTELVDADILVPLPVERGGVGAQTYSATAKTSLDNADRFGIWDSITGRLRSVTWTLIKATLKTYFDTLYSVLSHTHAYLTDAPSNGNQYARKDGAWDIVAAGGGGHLHGLARWNSSGGTTFDLPDIAEYIESVFLNGLQEDPLLYSLSSDRTQVIFDSATTAADIVIAKYVLAQV